MRKLLLAASVLAYSQPSSKLSFEVASVRPAASSSDTGAGTMSGGPGTSDPQRITYTNATLQLILMDAYGVRPARTSGPGWLAPERYNIVAKVPPGATWERVSVMLQNLLAERFNAAVSLPGIVERELGLRFEKAKGAVDMLVIDHLDKTPTPN